MSVYRKILVTRLNYKNYQPMENAELAHCCLDSLRHGNLVEFYHRGAATTGTDLEIAERIVGTVAHPRRRATPHSPPRSTER